jgi:hypothetical protein
MRAAEAFSRFLEYEWDWCLDVGAGMSEHGHKIREIGRSYVRIDLIDGQDYMAFVTAPAPAIWCSHVLEHQTNAGSFLEKIHRDLIAGGVLAITVPPAKPQIVGGHVSHWNAGLLLYQLVLAGFDCSKARVGTYDYNISVIVEKKSIHRPAGLRGGGGDIELLAPYFPTAIGERFGGKYEGFNGELENIDWR